jgi:beta-lactamase regulating signal transducer with metallopeptidase domain/Tfp pilus assembly protein PilF
VIAHLVSSTAVALVAVLAVAALRRDRAAWRHAILVAAVLRFAIPTDWLRVVPAGIIEDFAPLLLHPGPIDTISRAAAPVAATFDWRIVWAAGAMLSLLLWGWRALRRIPAVREATWEEMQMFPGVPLRIVAADRVPGASGLFRQSVVLPDGLAQHLSVAEMQAVVAHEMAHVRRFDNLTAAMVRAVVSVFWFHPLLWWLERRMLAERETACDEMVLGQGIERYEYVSGIAKVCRMSFAGATGYAGVNGSNLHRRMEHIMYANLTFTPSRFLRAAAGVLLAGVTLVPVAGELARAQTAMTSRETMVAVEEYMKAGRSDDAVALLQAEIAKAPARLDLQLSLGNVLVRTRRFDEALAVFVRLLDGIAENAKQRADIYLRIGEVYRRKGDAGQAIAMLEKARALAPENVIVLSTLGLSLDAAGRWDEAKQIYRDVLKLQDHGVSMNNLAYLLVERGGDLDEALALSQRAKQLLPNTWEVTDTLGWIYLKRNMSNDAVEMFADVVLKAPHRREFRDHLVLALDQRGDTAASVQELKELLRGTPSPEADQRMVALVRALPR